jgi:hypothetical protein
MELIRIVNDIKEGLNVSGVITDDIVIIKDEVSELDELFRSHNQSYLGYLQIININPDFSGSDQMVIVAGVYGVSTGDDDDYLQVVSKSAYTLKECMKHIGYTNDDDLDNASFVVDATRDADNVKIITYTTFNVDLKLSYGSQI